MHACARRPLPLEPMAKYLEGLDRTTGLDFWRSHLLNVTPTPFIQTLPGAPRALANESVTPEVEIKRSSLAQQFGIMGHQR
jgi:hypothetical protein